MDKNLEKSLLEICTALSKHSVAYIIVGGTAVALNGYFRHSIDIRGIIAEKPDIDVWYMPTYNNYYSLLSALEELGQDVLEFRNEDAPNLKKTFFRYELDRYTLDLLPSLPGLGRFKDCYDNKEIVDWDGTEIPFLNYTDLIKSKKETGRDKDISDIEELKNIKGDVDEV